ncbi:MAG: acetate/propionate family kinase, partial [Prevotellaceae bacterium]|nr:acetate/propionate family kinase [Prevotellaceae bacterium]
YGVRRYGFHGTSHRYVSARALEFLGMKAEGTKVITAHIGNGGSLAAVVDGKCVDTSMGLTPLEGVMMGTRSGDIDGGAITFIEKKLGLDADGISNLLNKKSGVFGLCGYTDMRDVASAAANGDKKAEVAQDSYFYRVKKYVGAYTAAMGGCDVLVFTAGVGENQAAIREEVCKNMEFMGMKIDVEKNKDIHGEEAIISTPDSKVKVVVIPTDEELMIASDTMALVK